MRTNLQPRPCGPLDGPVAPEAPLADTRPPRPFLRVVPAATPVDLDAASAAAREFLIALGVDLTAESLDETPLRMARGYAEMLSAPAFTLTTFPNVDNYDELVLVRDIPFRSVCEHHFLPFVGVARVGYLPGDRLLGLSKFSRVIQAVAAAPQVQERLTGQIANLIEDALAPSGLGVVLDAEHLCMTGRGARALGATTRTTALRGSLRDDSTRRAEFTALTRSTTAGGTLPPAGYPGSEAPDARSQ